MDLLALLQTFVQVAEASSFSGAARELGRSQSSVSRAVAELESHLRLQLLDRSTHHVHLTSQGEACLERAQRALAAVAEVQAHEGAAQEARLRLRVPPAFGRDVVAPHLHEFLSAHPHVAIELDVTERAEEIARPGCDVALVLGPFATSSMVARRLGMIERRVVAAPSLARRVGKLSSPRALEEVPCVVFRGSGPTWTFRRGGAVEFVRPRARFISTSVEAVRIVALAGVGVALLPHWLIAVDLEKGRLRALLTGHRVDPLELTLLWPGSKRSTPTVVAFVSWLEGAIARAKVKSFQPLQPGSGPKLR